MSQLKKLRVALVVPHIFLHRDILPHVIFSPGTLAIELAEGLATHAIDVTLFSPGPVDTTVPTVCADMSYFETELAGRNDTYIDLLKKHPFTFVSLARQVQTELIAKAYQAANNDEYDVVHIYTNEEDTALPFAQLCQKPVVFTHHDPFNFMVKYKSVFPKYTHLPWISMSYAQRSSMPADTHWIGNVYHGINPTQFEADTSIQNRDYIAYLGRIIEPKGVHLAIAAVKKYNETAQTPMTLKIAGKHYANDTYWDERIAPELDGHIEHVGFIKDTRQKNVFLRGAKALIIPSTFNEPFGMVMIEALASGTPIIGLDNGAISEVITNATGILIQKSGSENETVTLLAGAMEKIGKIDRQACRNDFEARFTLNRMCAEHATIYRRLQNN